MEPAEVKEASPKLVVGDEIAEALHEIDSLKANADENKTEQAGSAALMAPGQNSDQSKAEPIAFVLTVVDLAVACFLLLAFTIALITGPFSPGSEAANALRNAENAACIFISLFINTYYLSDVKARLHKARGKVGFWPRFDKLACIHPLLVFPFVYSINLIFMNNMIFLNAAYYPTAISAFAIVTGLGLFAASLRWLHSVLTLPYACSHLGANGTQKTDKRAALLGGFAVVCMSISGWWQSDTLILLLSNFCSIISFIVLRNKVIRSTPQGPLTTTLPAKTKPVPEGEVQIRYSHFVEIQKWFKQRFALRSPWKIALVLLILVAAIAGHIHQIVLDFIVNNIAVLAGPAPAAPAIWGNPKLHITAAELAADQALQAQELNRLANSALVMAFGWFTFLVGAGSLFAFIRAPKKIAAGKEGLRLIFARASGKRDLKLDWQSIKHIKVERPKGKTSAASDRLVFEQFRGRPLTLKLAGISSADDREKLLGAIDRFAPHISREAAIEETLRRPMEQNYTELWLQALAAPPKREKLKPLIKDAVLSDNRYLVLRELGVGGQGFAYLARDQRKDKDVVLKEFVLPVFVDINARRQSLESFEKEAKLMTRLNHPQVVKLEGFFVEDHRAYLVLEHIDGQNLRQIVEREGPMPEERIKELAAQMCAILIYLHGLSPPLVHRDFTPDNLILHRDGTLKLIDFNVAQQVEYATTGTVVGKQAYLPPEQFRGQAVPASDLYAFGATLYFLASGKDPTPISVSRPMKDGLCLSPQLDALISSLTQMEPQARPLNAQAAAELLGPLPDIADKAMADPVDGDQDAK